MFPPALADFIEVWVGGNVARGNEDQGFESRAAFTQLADDISALSDAMMGAIATAKESLPPKIAEEFIAAVKLFVDDGGENHLQKFSTELRDIASRQSDRAMKLGEAKYQILIEFILMNLELALLAVLSVFTGGTSLSEIAAAKARTALAIILILQRLGRAVPTPLSAVLEAIQEAFVTFMSQVISMTAPDNPDRRRDEFDWLDIGQSAVMGALAGAFGGLFSEVTQPIVKKYFKDSPVWKELTELPLSFINEGQSEMFAEAFTKLFFTGEFSLNPGTFLSAGTSGLLFEGASDIAEFGGKWLHNNFFQNYNFNPNDINSVTADSAGNGDGPRPDTVSDNDSYDSYNAYNESYNEHYTESYDVPPATGPAVSQTGDQDYTVPLVNDASAIGDVADTDSASDTSDFSNGRDDSSIFSGASDNSSVSDYDGADDFQVPPVYGGFGHGLTNGATTTAYSGPATGAQATGGPLGVNGAAKPPYSAPPSYLDGDDAFPEPVIARDSPATTGDASSESIFTTLHSAATTASGNDLSADSLPNVSTVGSPAPAPPSFTPAVGSGYQDPDGLLVDQNLVDEDLADENLVGEEEGLPGRAGVNAGTGTGTGTGSGSDSRSEESVRQGTADDDTVAPVAEDEFTDTNSDGNATTTVPGHATVDPAVPAERADSATEPNLVPDTDAVDDIAVSPAVHVPPGTTPEDETVVQQETQFTADQPEQTVSPAPLPAAAGTAVGGPGAAAPQQRPQTLSDPAQAAAPEAFAATSPTSGPAPAADAPAADSDATEAPPPYRPVRTESEGLSTDRADGTGVPVPVDVPRSLETASDAREFPLDVPVGEYFSSSAPDEIPVGSDSPRRPGSPDSIDMIMDWEDGEDPASVGESMDDMDASTVPPPFTPEEIQHHQQLLAGVFGAGIASNRIYPGLREAVGRLDRLRRLDPVLRDGPLDLDAVTRRVLGLDSAAPVTGGQRSELFRVAMDEAVESAGSLAALAAFHLQLRGVLSLSRAMTTPVGAVRGRNWTDTAIPDLDATTVGRRVRQPDDTFVHGDVRTAPWHRPGGPEPYIVVAAGAHDHVVVRGFDGTARRVPIDVFAELLALDPALAGLPADVPVVLLIPGAGARGLDLPRRTADRLGRDTWSANGAVNVAPQQDPSLPHTVSLSSGDGRPRADWIRSTPGQVLDPAEYEGAPAWERDMLSHTIVTDNGPIGRAVFDDAEAPSKMGVLRHATEARELWHRNPATDVWTKDDEPVPFAGKPVYVFAAHAWPGQTHLPTEGKKVKVARRTETGGMLKRRPSLAQLPKDHGVLMEACWDAAQEGVTRARRDARDAFVPDPLAVISDGQQASNVTGRTVYGGTRTIGIVQLPGRGWVHVSLTDAQGRRGRWVEFRPEPTGDVLDDRARAAGLHTGPGPVPDETRERALRLVRALRLALGVGVEDDSRYGDLLRGIGELETMREADPWLGDFAPFTMDLLERAARADRQRRHGAAVGVPGPDAYRDLLLAAAEAAYSQPGTALSDFVSLPHVVATAQRLSGLADLDAEAVTVLRLDGDAPTVGGSERSRLFWATAKALEWESRVPDPDALTAKVLHLDQPDPARRTDLFQLAAQAAAVGRDLDNPTELAAFHLELLGALSPETQLLDVNGAATGRQWARSEPNVKVDTSRVIVAALKQSGGYGPAGVQQTPWSAANRPAPYTVWAGPGTDQLHMTLPGGFQRRVPYDEVAELLSRDPVLSDRKLDVDVVLAASKVVPTTASAGSASSAGPASSTGPVASTGPAASPAAPAGAGAPNTDPRAVISSVTGRGVWASRGGTAMGATGPSKPYVPTLLPTVPGGPVADDWGVVRPRDLLSPAAAASAGNAAETVTFADTDMDAGTGTARDTGPGTRTDTDPTTPAPGITPSTDPILEVAPDPSVGSSSDADLTVALVPKPTESDPPPPDRPRLDRDLAPPPKRRAQARFEDGRRMPQYVDDLQSLLPAGLTAAEIEQLLANPTTFGQSTVVLRGFDQAVDTIDRELRRRPDTRPDRGDTQLLTDIRQTLRDKPKTLADGDGRPFPYVNAAGKTRVLYVRARHYGNWSPFDDSIGNASKIDSMHRGAATFGLTKNMQTNSQYGLGGPIGPASTAAFGGFGRLALRFGFINKVGYTLTDQRMNQMETRTLDESRSFLDDIYYEIRVTDTAGRVVTGTDTDPTAPASFAFGIRNGLTVRLPDSVTKMPKPGRIPRSIDLDRNSQYRFVRIEGFGPVAAIRDWAAGQIGVLPGSSAYTELDTFFSGDSFQRHGGTMARGRITTPPLFADDDKKSPLGVFVVEELIPRAAVLVGETDQAEMRDINTSTVRNERSRATGRSLLLQAVAGPAFNLFDPGTAPFDLRLLFGPTAQYSYAKTYSAGLGGAGTLKSAGQVKGPKTALYLVVKSVRVRRAGDNAPPTRFLTWSLDRMTSAEARRLAGWDDGTSLVLRHGGAPPYVPAYLTVDRPPTLGMHRVKEFTFDDGKRTRVTPDVADGVGRTLLDAFADGVVNALANQRRGLVVPLDQLLPPNLPKGWRARFDDLLTRKPDQALAAARSLPMPPRWTDPVKYQIALQNTLQVLGVLSQQNITANLEALTTIGLPIRLTDPDSVGQTYYTVRVQGTLTGRRYEGKDIDEGMRYSAQGVDRLDGQTSAKRGVDLGFEGTFSGRDNNVDSAGLPQNTLGLTLGARQGWQWEAENAFGSTVTNEPMSVSNQPTHLYRYDIALTATLSGYWRPRGLIRGFGLGLPGLLVLDEPVNVLFGRTARGHLRGGGPMTGQVLISVPVQHTPDADPHADGALNPYLSDQPAPTPVTTQRALALARGDLVLPAGTGKAQPAGRLAERGTRQFKEFQQHPFVIVNMVLPPTLVAEVNRVLKTASGSAWQLVKEGAPTREAIVRTFTPQYLAASFDQSSGPLGLAGSGLLGKGPYGELWGTFRYATTVEGLHTLTPSMSMDTEMTLGGTRQAAGKISNSTSFVFGGQLIYSVAQHPGHGVMGAYGIVANPVSTSGTHSLSVVRTVVADMNRKGFTHQVLVAGDVHHWFALSSSRLGTGRLGTAAAASALVPRSLAGAAGTALTSPGGLLGHLPEKSAHRMGLLDDGMGEVPRYTRQLWAPQPWLRGAAFGTYAVNPLDPTDVLLAFDQRIRKLDLDDESRERIRQLVTARATRALKGEMTTTGPSTMVTVGGWGWDSVRIGNRHVRARVELIPGTPAFDGLDHSVELEENRRAIETVQKNSESSSGADVGLLTSQLVYTGNAYVAGAGPSYTESGSHRRTVASSHANTTVTIYRAASTEPHAQIVTPYRMRITLEADDTPSTGAPADKEPQEGKPTALDRFRGRLQIIEEGDVGELREHVPLSLMEPVPSQTTASTADGNTSQAGRLLPAPDPAADPALAQAPRPVPLPKAGEELTVRDGDGVTRTFTFPENGIHPRGIVGIENLRIANDLLLTKAYDVGFPLSALEAEDGPDPATLTKLLRRTRETGLTRLGIGSAQALEDGTSSTAITAFYPRTTEPDGYQVAGLTEKSILGTDTGQLTLRSTPDFSRALLLTVADGKKLEVLRRYGENAGTSSANEHSQTSNLGGAFLYDSPNSAGLNQIGLFGPGPNDLDGDGMPVGDDHLTSRNLKPQTQRSFLFAVPATWLSVGDVHRSVVDSKPANRIRGGTFSKARSGPQAMESETYVIAWIREDIARDLRLITDENFPERVGKAWDAVTAASQAWIGTDKAYWTKRRASGHLRKDLDAAQAAFDEAAGIARAAALPVDLARTDADAADTALRQAESDAVRDHGTADAAVATAQAAVDALTENEPEHDGWAQLLRDEQHAARARLAEAMATAEGLRKAADLRLETARTEKAEADERLDTALLSARAPGRSLDDATARRNTALDDFNTRRDELDELRDAAEKAAAEYHRVRAGADQLTRWHRLAASEEGRKELDGLAEQPEVTYQAPPEASETPTPAPPRYTRTGTGPDTVLWSPKPEAGSTSPGQQTAYTLHDVPRDGDAFFRALAHGLERAAPGLLAAEGIDLDDPRAMAELRRRMASWLTDHADHDLLAAVAPDTTDAFSAQEITAAGLDLGTDTSARREFDDLDGLIPHAVDLSPEIRAELAVAQLLRRGDAASEAGWDHAAADLLPLLAARTFGVRITVVGSDGGFQDFSPEGPTREGNLQGLVEEPRRPRAHVVLSLDDRHYQLAVPTGQARPTESKASRSKDPAQQETRQTQQVEQESQKDIEKGSEPQVTESLRARGRRVRVPATGECLLYSFMAGDPVHVQSRLRGLASADRTAYDWLARPDSVRGELRRQAANRARTGKLPTGPAHVVLQAMRSVVEDYVGRSEGRLHPQIIGQFRQTVADAFAERVRGMNRAEMLAQLAHHRVRHAPVPEALEPTELLRRYVDARMASEPTDPDISPQNARAVQEAAAENLSPRQMFDHLKEHGLLPTPDELDDSALGRLLRTVYSQSAAPLDDHELPTLLDAVVNWEQRWETAAGEIFLPLLAHAFTMRVDVVQSFPSGTRRISRAGPDNALRHTEVYYNGTNHYDGSDAVPRDRFGSPVLPKRVKDEELDSAGDVRLNPLWVPLDEVDPNLLITGNRDAVWLYTVTEDGRVLLGTEKLTGIVTMEQFDALLAGMREKDPGLTAESLRKALDGLGHTGIAADFVTADGEKEAGRTLPGRSRVSGEFRWDAKVGSWVVNDKSGRYMSESVRPGLDAAEAADWLDNVAALFSDRLGVVVRPDQVKTAAPVAAPLPPPPLPAVPPPSGQLEPPAPPVPPEPDQVAVSPEPQPERDAGRDNPEPPTHEHVSPSEQAHSDPAEAEMQFVGLGADPNGPASRLASFDVDHVPVVRRDDAQRQRLARQLTAEDLPENPPGLDDGDTVSLADLRTAGIAITPGMDVEAQLGGGALGSGLGSLDQVRLLMVRPGPWPDVLDAIAATTSRRVWRSAFADFASAVSADGRAMDAARAWDTAVGLVLPRESHSVVADSRYSGERFRNAVRQVADLLAEETDRQTAVHVANRLRHGLGLPPL
ncbi:lonely Cys domain-containing protein [Streptomyces sp. A30]|uniref:lonely Cys domain-containing protein n=1 Tax=Streptomyces sp. A30 TaxID=2789273 RepID=UPI00397F5858